MGFPAASVLELLGCTVPWYHRVVVQRPKTACPCDLKCLLIGKNVLGNGQVVLARKIENTLKTSNVAVCITISFLVV